MQYVIVDHEKTRIEATCSIRRSNCARDKVHLPKWRKHRVPKIVAPARMRGVDSYRGGPPDDKARLLEGLSNSGKRQSFELGIGHLHRDFLSEALHHGWRKFPGHIDALIDVIKSTSRENELTRHELMLHGSLSQQEPGLTGLLIDNDERGGVLGSYCFVTALPVLFGLSRCGAVSPHRAISQSKTTVSVAVYFTVDLIDTVCSVAACDCQADYERENLVA